MAAESPESPALIEWLEDGRTCRALWRSQTALVPPRRVVLADDTLTADAAYRLACSGTALLWRGDYHNARQLLQALARRIERKPRRAPPPAAAIVADDFHRQRMAQAQRARILSMLLVPFAAGHQLTLRRAPDVRAACSEAYGAASEPYVSSLRELLGVIGAHEWRRNGVQIDLPDAPGFKIHPHYGVFSPVRGEYVALVARAALPAALAPDAPQRGAAAACAFDIGTGTGVLAIVLARRGVARIVATDQDERALACAADNIGRLALGAQIGLLRADLFPPGRAALVVCNPPWVPGKPSSPLEHAVYDPDSRMLRGFLGGLGEHLAPGGEGWLIVSDLAERLGLRTRDELLALIDAAGLRVLGRDEVRPTHARARDASDPLHAARAAEITSLWRLGARHAGG